MSVWFAVCFIVILLLIVIIFFDVNSLLNLSQGSENAQQGIENLQKANVKAGELKEDLNKTIGRVQNELVTLGGFLLPLLKTPQEICEFCTIYGKEKINYFTPTDAVLIVGFCQKASDIFQCEF